MLDKFSNCRFDLISAAANLVVDKLAVDTLSLGVLYWFLYDGHFGRGHFGLGLINRVLWYSLFLTEMLCLLV